MLKRISMLFMALVLGLFLAGCGDTDMGGGGVDDGLDDGVGTTDDTMTDTGTDADDGGGIDY